VASIVETVHITIKEIRMSLFLAWFVGWIVSCLVITLYASRSENFDREDLVFAVLAFVAWPICVPIIIMIGVCMKFYNFMRRHVFHSPS
jgi:hypothetical protein